VASRTYSVTFIPAWENGAFITTSPFDTISRQEVTATSLDDLLLQVNRLGNALGRGAQAYVYVPRGKRKPPKFDERTRGLYYGLDGTPEAPSEAPVADAASLEPLPLLAGI
jgi:hypothetical protein